MTKGNILTVLGGAGINFYGEKRTSSLSRISMITEKVDVVAFSLYSYYDTGELKI